MSGEPDAVPSRFDWRLPPGFPVPTVPPANPMTAAKVELGRHLFHDRRLSGNGTYSCATCHRQELAFTDGRAHAIGSTGERHPRSTMSLANVAYNASLNWADPRARTLEQQMLVPMFNQDPVELGVSGKEELVIERLHEDPRYREMFREAFPDDGDPLTFRNIIKAIASFERTLISGDSPYDRLVYGGEMSAMSPEARRGMRLFYSERLACSKCHADFNLSGPLRLRQAEGAEPAFHNNGLYNIDGKGDYPPESRGLIDFTGRRKDTGRFRAPTLRNVELTAPYMHDGSVSTLEEVIEHYARGGRDSRYKSRLVKGFEMTDQEKSDLIEFLKSLTDESFLTDPRFKNPFAGDTKPPGYPAAETTTSGS